MHFNPSQRFVCQLIGLSIAIFGVMPGYAQTGDLACGSLTNGYGPYDYRTDKSKLGIVERYHFTPAVETLIRGSTNVLPGPDLDYTLRAFPNHHRALMSMMRYGEKMKSPQPRGTGYSVTCYFERAVRFRPDDTIARMLYATFLSKNSRTPEAIRQLELATVEAADNGFSHYNIGLIYFDLKKYDKALIQAHKAIALGFLQSALRDELKSVGQWREPADLPRPPAATASAPVTLKK